MKCEFVERRFNPVPVASRCGSTQTHAVKWRVIFRCCFFVADYKRVVRD